MRNLPIMLKPAGKDYLWGGNRLNDDFGKSINLTPLAETWECSTHPDGPSIIESGLFAGRTLTEVICEHPEYLGSHARSFGDLPILVKMIDAKQDLSVQVHPSDDYAKEHENGQMGKSEMWYVLDASKGAKLIYGLHTDTEKEVLLKAAENGTIAKYLQKIPVKKDEVFFVEAGTIHAIGKGALIVEVQENSNLTYRLYDYDRLDKNGNKRQLHIEKALDVANLKSSISPKQPMRVLRYHPGVAIELLCRCKYFEVSRMLINTELRQNVEIYADEMSYRVILCIDGCGTFSFAEQFENFYKGDCMFVPANSEIIKIHGKAQLLEIKG